MPSNQSQPAIILIKPQMGENIGATARAMLNFGFTDLRIVAPRDGWPNAAANANASGAFDTITPRIYDTFAKSIADCHYTYVTTARHRELKKPVSDIAQACDTAHQKIEMGQKTALVFGPERTGAENEDVAQCNEIVNIPTNPNFSSLNLSQAVLLCVYAFANANKEHTQAHTDNTAFQDIHTPAPYSDFENLFSRLESALDEHGFFRENALRPTMVKNIKTTLLPTRMDEQEIRTFHGMISALTKAQNKV